MSPRRAQVRDLFIPLDRNAKASLGRQLEDQLREAIRGGRLVAGEPLPSTRVLAQDLGVSRGVVARTYAQLAAEGYLSMTQGANPRVGRLPQERPRTTPRWPSDGRHWQIDLRAEQPDLSLFPRREWERSLRTAVRGASNAELGYIDRHGLPRARNEIAAYLGRVRGAHADPDRVVVTEGASHGLMLIARALLQQGHERIAFENPSHKLLRELVSRTGLAPVGVPVDAHGIRVDELERTSVRAAVVSPAHQFPLGVCLSVERRRQLIDWAERNDGIVIENDYVAEFRFDRAPIGAIQGLAPERVAYLGSASKTLAPAIRLGWAVLPAAMVEPVSTELWATTLHTPALAQLAFADFVGRGEFDRHVRRARAAYRRRRDVTIAALTEEFPELPISGISAGLHVLAGVPAGLDEDGARDKAAAAGIGIDTISAHALPGYGGAGGLIIGYAGTPEPTIPHAVRALAEALDSTEDARTAA